MATKKSVAIELRDTVQGEQYHVTKTVNTLVPKVGIVVTEREVDGLIRGGVTVTITPQKIKA
jgi:hypothetical protein